MKKLIIPVLLLLASLAVSCHKKIDLSDGTPIPYVVSILEDAESAEYKVLKSFDPSVKDAAIYVIGDRAACSIAVAELLEADDRDNIDGMFKPDSLPDFAGERIASFADVAYGSHDQLVVDGKADLLKELTVRSVVKALDSLCFVSPFDTEGQGHKSAAKLIVLADPAAARYGRYDVGYLMEKASCPIPVVSPLYTLAREMISADDVTVGVITTRRRSDTGIYADILSSAASAGGFKGQECVVKIIDRSNDPLLSFLDRYRQEGHARPLDYLLVDVPGADFKKMEETLELIRSVMNEESLRYSSCISKDFKIVETGSALRRECYDILREQNLFTHKIAFPAEERYLNVAANDDNGLENNKLIEFNTRFLPR